MTSIDSITFALTLHDHCVALDGGSFQWEENLNVCVNDSSIGNGKFVALC